MDIRKVTRAAVGSLLLAMGFQLSGCSVAGFFIGAGMDSETRPVEVAPSSYADLEPGTPMTVLMRDSTEVTGTLGGQGRVPEDQYATRYTAWWGEHRGDSAMPRIGDELFLFWPTPATEGGSGRLVSFDPQWIRIRPPKGDKDLNLWSPAVVRAYDSHGQAIDMRRIMALMEKGEIPYSSYVVVLDRGTRTQISAERIREILKPATKSKKWIGLLTGAVLDCTAYFIWDAIRIKW